MKPRTLAELVAVLLVAPLFAINSDAQNPALGLKTIEIQVRVTSEDGRTPLQQVRVELLSLNDVPLQQLFTDVQGHASFMVDVTRPTLEFQVRASGKGLEETTSEHIRFDREMEGGTIRIVSLQVKSTSEPPPQSKAAVTSVAQGQVPKDARNAMRDGLKEWEKKNYQQAAADFEKATVLYPQYDEAFNDLGMMYAHLDQPDKSRAAFETAVRLNDKNASADRNLAGVMLSNHDYQSAGDLARKSLAVDPSNAFAWTIAAIADFQAGNPDLAVRACRRAHESPHEGYALCHFVAGQAFERLHDPAAAKAEYEVYLKETPDGPETPKVKQALARLATASAEH